jgi:hypothetical protein
MIHGYQHLLQKQWQQLQPAMMTPKVTRTPEATMPEVTMTHETTTPETTMTQVITPEATMTETMTTPEETMMTEMTKMPDMMTTEASTPEMTMTTQAMTPEGTNPKATAPCTTTTSKLDVAKCDILFCEVKIMCPSCVKLSSYSVSNNKYMSITAILQPCYFFCGEPPYNISKDLNEIKPICQICKELCVIGGDGQCPGWTFLSS